MAIPSAVDFTIKFDQTNDPANFSLEDTTDYVGDSIALEDVRGCFTNVEDPLGNIIHANTDFSSPDIEPASSLIYTGIDIPTDVNDDILEGEYEFTYGIKVDKPITAVNTGAKRFTIAGDWVTEISASTSIVVVRSTGNDGTYTISTVTLNGSNTEIVVTEVVPNATADGSIQYSSQAVYSQTNTVTYNDVIAVIDIDVEYDCFCGSLTSTDATSYGSTATILSRTHTVVYPAALEHADVTSSSAVITISPIYTKTWTTIIETTVEYAISGGTIEVTITGSKDTVVDCDLSLCDISCGVIALENRYTNAQTTNPVLAKTYFEQLTRIFQLVSEFKMQQECGQNDKASETLGKIRTAGDFTADCGCDDSDEPQQIVPLCGSAATSSIVTAGTGISVSASGSGTITYQVSLSQAYLNIIAALAPVNVVAGTGISVVKTTPGGVDTYTITNDAPFDPLNTQQAQCFISYSNFAAPTVSVTTSYIVKEGSNMTDMVVASGGNVGVGLWKYEANYFTVTGFQTTPNATFKPIVSMVQLTTQTLAGVVTAQGNQYLTPQPIDVRILDQGSESFIFQFVEKATGNPLSNYAMVYNRTILVHIEIKQ